MPDRRRELGLLLGGLGAFFLSVSLLIPTLPLYVRDLGGGPVEIGLVVGVFSLGVLFARPFVGRLVDTRGRRAMMILGAVVVTLTAPLYALLPIVGALVAVRLVHGAGLSAFTTGSTTMGADLAPPERRTEFLGWLSSTSVIAFAIGPFVGLEVAERWGWTPLFLGVAACGAVALGCVALLDRAPRADDDGAPVDYRAAIFRRQVIAPTATLLLVTISHGGSFAFLPILFEERLAFNFGFFFLAYSAASLATRLLAGRLSRAWGDGPMVWGGLATYAVGLAALPLVRGAGTMTVAAVLLGVGFSVYQPAVYGLVANAATDRTRGMVFSAFLGAFDFGIGAGGLVAGPIVAAAGIPALLLALAILPLLAAAVFVGALGWRPDPTACAVAPEPSVP